TVTAKLQKLVAGLGAVAMSASLAGCGGEFVKDSRSPVRLVVNKVEVNDDEHTLRSDVITMVTSPEPCKPESPCPAVLNDMAVVNMSLVLRDPGNPASPSSPSDLNQVTINRYRVQYRRSDGHN